MPASEAEAEKDSDVVKEMSKPQPLPLLPQPSGLADVDGIAAPVDAPKVCAAGDVAGEDVAVLQASTIASEVPCVGGNDAAVVDAPGVAVFGEEDAVGGKDAVGDASVVAEKEKDATDGAEENGGAQNAKAVSSSRARVGAGAREGARAKLFTVAAAPKPSRASRRMKSVPVGNGSRAVFRPKSRASPPVARSAPPDSTSSPSSAEHIRSIVRILPELRAQSAPIGLAVLANVFPPDRPSSFERRAIGAPQALPSSTGVVMYVGGPVTAADWFPEALSDNTRIFAVSAAPKRASATVHVQLYRVSYTGASDLAITPASARLVAVIPVRSTSVLVLTWAPRPKGEGTLAHFAGSDNAFLAISTGTGNVHVCEVSLSTLSAPPTSTATPPVVIQTLCTPCGPKSPNARALTWHPSGTSIVVGRVDGSIAEYRLTWIDAALRVRVAWRVTGHKGGVLSMAWLDAEDGVNNVLVSSGTDGWLKFRDRRMPSIVFDGYMEVGSWIMKIVTLGPATPTVLVIITQWGYVRHIQFRNLPIFATVPEAGKTKSRSPVVLASIRVQTGSLHCAGVMKCSPKGVLSSALELREPFMCYVYCAGSQGFVHEMKVTRYFGRDKTNSTLSKSMRRLPVAWSHFPEDGDALKMADEEYMDQVLAVSEARAAEIKKRNLRASEKRIGKGEMATTVAAAAAAAAGSVEKGKSFGKSKLPTVKPPVAPQSAADPTRKMESNAGEAPAALSAEPPAEAGTGEQPTTRWGGGPQAFNEQNRLRALKGKTPPPVAAESVADLSKEMEGNAGATPAAFSAESPAEAGTGEPPTTPLGGGPQAFNEQARLRFLNGKAPPGHLVLATAASQHRWDNLVKKCAPVLSKDHTTSFGEKFVTALSTTCLAVDEMSMTLATCSASGFLVLTGIHPMLGYGSPSTLPNGLPVDSMAAWLPSPKEVEVDARVSTKKRRRKTAHSKMVNPPMPPFMKAPPDMAMPKEGKACRPPISSQDCSLTEQKKEERKKELKRLKAVKVEEERLAEMERVKELKIRDAKEEALVAVRRRVVAKTKKRREEMTAKIAMLAPLAPPPPPPPSRKKAAPAKSKKKAVMKKTAVERSVEDVESGDVDERTRKARRGSRQIYPETDEESSSGTDVLQASESGGIEVHDEVLVGRAKGRGGTRKVVAGARGGDAKIGGKAEGKGMNGAVIKRAKLWTAIAFDDDSEAERDSDDAPRWKPGRQPEEEAVVKSKSGGSGKATVATASAGSGRKPGRPQKDASSGELGSRAEASGVDEDALDGARGNGDKSGGKKDAFAERGNRVEFESEAEDPEKVLAVKKKSGGYRKVRKAKAKTGSGKKRGRLGKGVGGVESKSKKKAPKATAEDSPSCSKASGAGADDELEKSDETKSGGAETKKREREDSGGARRSKRIRKAVQKE